MTTQYSPSLVSPVGTTSPHPGDPSHGSPSSPGLSGVFMASHVVDTVCLSSIQSHVGVTERHKVISDRCTEDTWHVGLSSNLVRFGVVDADSWTGSHLE